MPSPHEDPLPELAATLAAELTSRWADLKHRSAARPDAALPETALRLPDDGVGAQQAVTNFLQQIAPDLNGGVGPHYAGYVTGGVTPAALAGDWLTPVFDTNAAFSTDSAAGQLEQGTVSMLLDLLGLPAEFGGTLTAGATSATTVGLAAARQWAGDRFGVDVAQSGAAVPISVLSGTAHASAAKSLAILGIGRQNLIAVPCLPDREAVDIAALRTALSQHQDSAVIVVANAGTVITGDTDDLAEIAALRDEFNFWLHVDAAFGGFAALLPGDTRLSGWQWADSITVDLHKWLNVPYDSGLALIRNAAVLPEIFGNTGSYLAADPQPMDQGLDNSRRLRALPIWLSLQAYGRAGISRMIQESVAAAHEFAELVTADDRLQLAAPVRLNVVTLSSTSTDIHAAGERLASSGDGFLSPATWQSHPVLRGAFVNWRTDPAELATALLTHLDEAAGLGTDQ
jgi:glutamate/tyrosine decarboxylase-like PLP-dependent enzyme